MTRRRVLVVAVVLGGCALVAALGCGDANREQTTLSSGEVASAESTSFATTTTRTAVWDGEARLYLASPERNLPRDTKRGYIDSTGAWVIEPRFANAADFSEDLAAVRLGGNGKWGYIDQTGTVVIEPRFDGAGDFSEGLALVRVDQSGGPWGYIDKTGVFAIEPAFHHGSQFSEGFAAVCLEGTWGYVDKTGTMVIEPRFDYAGDFSQGLACVGIDRPVGYYISDWFFIDKAGKVVLEFRYEDYDLVEDFSEGLATVYAVDEDENVTSGYIDKTGDFAIAPVFDDGWDFTEGLAAVTVGDKDGYIDKTGAFVIEPIFDWAEPFSEGLAAVQLDGKYGYIDKTGTFVIEPEFHRAESFSGDLAWVYTGGVRGYIDKTGILVYSEAWGGPPSQSLSPGPSPSWVVESLEDLDTLMASADGHTFYYVLDALPAGLEAGGARLETAANVRAFTTSYSGSRRGGVELSVLTVPEHRDLDLFLFLDWERTTLDGVTYRYRPTTPYNGEFAWTEGDLLFWIKLRHAVVDLEQPITPETIRTYSNLRKVEFNIGQSPVGLGTGVPLISDPGKIESILQDNEGIRYMTLMGPL